MSKGCGERVGPSSVASSDDGQAWNRGWPGTQGATVHLNCCSLDSKRKSRRVEEARYFPPHFLFASILFASRKWKEATTLQGHGARYVTWSSGGGEAWICPASHPIGWYRTYLLVWRSLGKTRASRRKTRSSSSPGDSPVKGVGRCSCTPFSNMWRPA